jgi:diguanylate cyclase (GGDEF)-like protein
MHGGDEESRAKLNDVHFDLDADPRLAELMAIEAPLTATPGVDDPVTFGWALHASRAWLAIPLTVRHERLGLLLLASGNAKTFGDAQPHLAGTLAGQGMIAYENARLFTEVRTLATVDGLTGVANRRHFYQLAARQLAEATATGHPLAALMLDIDHFKKINDTHGHQVGDEVIRAVADRLQTCGRGGDLIGRYGGEEFAILLQASGDPQAGADRLRRAVSDEPVLTPIGPVPVTVSVGVTTMAPDDTDIDDMLARADRCLYRAKQGGRNRVIHDGR